MVSSEEIREVAGQIGRRVAPRRVVLFGSYARGEEREGSDVDLLVVMETKERTVRVAAAIREGIEHDFPMDIIVRTPEQIEEGLKWGDSFLREVFERGVVLYEADDGWESGSPESKSLRVPEGEREMATAKRFEDLECWRKARELTRLVYDATSRGSFSRDFGLRDQMRRASVSIMLNIAEGFARKSDKEFGQFLVQGHGSCAEVQAAVYVALDQKYLSEEEFETLYRNAEEVSKKIMSLSKYLSGGPSGHSTLDPRP